MKIKNYIMLSIFSFVSALSHGQTTIVFQPNSATGEDAIVSDNSPNQNNASVQDMHSLAWTLAGTPFINRSFIRFDLSSIPVSAVIQQATLTLYNDPSSGANSGQHSSLSGSNESLLERVSSPWSENTITWNNQPTSVVFNPVILPQSTSPNQDYSIDASAQVQDMVNNPLSNFGFVLKLQTEQFYRCLVFASSDHPNAALRPRLEITYLDSCSNFFQQPDSITGVDAIVSDNSPNQNNATVEDIHSLAWTLAGTPFINRSFIRFDLTSIPVNAVVQYATLSLYNNPGSGATSGEHSNLSGSNASVLEKVTTPWSENTITWNNQPPSTTSNQTFVPQSISAHQNYVVDVTSPIQDMVTNPLSNFGFVLKLQTESFYRCLVFASSDNLNPALRPMLQICYSIAQSIQELKSKSQFELFPNPFLNDISIKYILEKPSDVSFVLMDCLGRKISEWKQGKQTAGNYRTEFSVLNSTSPGIYFFQMKVDGNIFSKKLNKE